MSHSSCLPDRANLCKPDLQCRHSGEAHGCGPNPMRPRDRGQGPSSPRSPVDSRCSLPFKQGLTSERPRSSQLLAVSLSHCVQGRQHCGRVTPTVVRPWVGPFAEQPQQHTAHITAVEDRGREHRNDGRQTAHVHTRQQSIESACGRGLCGRGWREEEVLDSVLLRHTPASSTAGG